MPRATVLKTNFSSGELSPRLLGRVDLDQYANGAEIIENALPLVHGGCRRRYGSRYIATAKDSTKKARLVPFVFSETEAYIVELGDVYARFFKNSATLGAPYEIVTPFTEAKLFETDYVQSADTMVLTHKTVFPQRLRRFADTDWAMDSIPFEVQPFDEIGHSFSATLTLSAATVGAGRVFTASSNIFLNGDVGREIFYLGGSAIITAFGAANQVTCTITSAFSTINVPADVWTLAGSPQESVTPGAKDPVGIITTLTAAALNTWRAADVGKWVRINGGLMQITSFTSALIVNARIVEVLSATVASPANAWSLEASVWSVANGYPRAATFYQQRLVLAGSSAYPQTLWGSSTGAYLDFTLGTIDSDAFAYTLASDQINPIMHMGSRKELFSFTYGAEFTARGGVEKPITPTNIQVEEQAAYGANTVKPVKVGKELVYVDQSSLQALVLAYDASDEDYDAEDLTLIAEHITNGTDYATGATVDRRLVDLSFQRKPDPVLWAPRADGVLASCSLSRKKDLVAWARQVTDGSVESVATIPVAGGHQTWQLVRRTVNGATVRYIEALDPSLNTDCAITGTSVGGLAVLPCAHLIGKTVHCVADGRYMGTFVVSGGGTITLPRLAFSWEIGLGYTHRIKLLTPEMGTNEGSSQGAAMSTSKVSARFLATYACDVNGRPIAFREFGSDLLDQPLTPFTGVKPIENLDWQEGESVIEFSSGLPLPFHLLSVARVFTANNG